MIGHNNPPDTIWFDVDENTPTGVPLIVFIPAENNKLGEESTKACGKLMGIQNGKTWVVNGHFGFDVGIPTKWTYMPDDPV